MLRMDEEPGWAVALERWCTVVRPGEQVLRIRNGGKVLCLAHRESTACLCLVPGWQGLLALRPGLQVVSGSAWVLPLSQMNLVKLQFFIDQGVAPGGGPLETSPGRC